MGPAILHGGYDCFVTTMRITNPYCLYGVYSIAYFISFVLLFNIFGESRVEE